MQPDFRAQTCVRYLEFRDRIHRPRRKRVISVAMIHLRNGKSVGTRTAWFLFIMPRAQANAYIYTHGHRSRARSFAGKMQIRSTAARSFFERREVRVRNTGACSRERMSPKVGKSGVSDRLKIVSIVHFSLRCFEN